MTRRARRRRNAALNDLSEIKAAQLLAALYAAAATSPFPFRGCAFPTCTTSTCTTHCHAYTRSTATEDPHA